MPRKRKTDPLKAKDPRATIASTANSDNKKTHTMKSKSGGTIDVKKKTVSDAKAGKGQYSKSTSYKGGAVKNKDGKMQGYKTQDGKYTATTDPVSRKAGAKALAKDELIHKSKSNVKDTRSASVRNATKK